MVGAEGMQGGPEPFETRRPRSGERGQLPLAGCELGPRCSCGLGQLRCRGTHPFPTQELLGQSLRPARRRPCLARDRKSTRLNSSHLGISYAVFCLKKKKKIIKNI